MIALLTVRLARVAALAAALVLTGSGVAVASPAGRTHSAAAPPAIAAPGGPTVTIAAILPRLPSATARDRTIRFIVAVTAGSTSLSGTELQLHRGNPLLDEAALRAAIKTPPSTDDVDIPALTVPGTIAAGQTRSVTMATTVDASTIDNVQGLCLSCNPGVYPVDVTLDQADSGTELARARTFVPYFTSAPAAVGISWVWPLLDRPHRALQRTVFDDDELATSLAPNGRLWRALRVAELVAGKVRLTLVVDPDLIDSIQVMSTGKYTVLHSAGSPSAGTGAAVATAWLARLNAVAPRHDVVRTAYADPDVDSLARAGVSWSTSQLLDPRLANSLRAELGVEAGTWLAWPAQGTLSGSGLDDIVANGASAALVSDVMFPSALGTVPTPDALAPLPSASGQATAVVLNSTLQTQVATAIATAATPAARFASVQNLAVDLSIRAFQEPTRRHYVALAPDRYADVSADATASLMLTLAATPFSVDQSMARAISAVTTFDRGALATSTATMPGLAADQLATLAAVRSNVDAFRECLSDKNALALLSSYPNALARAESSYFRLDPARGRTLAAGLLSDITSVTSLVRITSPNNASYTLASSDAPLFITVENRLTVPVNMALSVTPAAGERGLTVRAPASQSIPPGVHQIKVQAKVERTGQFRVALSLVSPSGKTFGTPSQIRVKSTAFGAVGLWVTGVAFAVLAIALLTRTVRRIRRRPRRLGGRPLTARGAVS